MKERNNILFYIIGIFAGVLFSHLFRSASKNKCCKTQNYENGNSLEGKVDEREEKIVTYVQKYGKINTKRCKEIMGVSEATANRALSNMFHREILDRAGAGRGIYYYLKNINN